MRKIPTTYRHATPKHQHKPIIETIINTAAIALTAAGTTWVLARDFTGLILIGVGIILEWFKYFGRDKWW